MKLQKTSKMLGALAAAGALMSAAGCGSANGRLPSNIPVQSQVALTAFNDCGALEKYVEDTAVLDMRSQLEPLRNGGGGGRLYEAGGVAPGTVDSSTAGAGPSSYTTTNTQVKGVDEADFVKNDGTRIFVLSGDTLYAHRSWPAETLAATAQLQIEGWPREMYLEGNTLMVFSGVWWENPFDAGRVGYGGMWPQWYMGYTQNNVTKVTTVDASDPSQLRVTGEQYLRGSYSTSRRVDTSVRVVLSESFSYPPDVQLYPDVPSSVWMDKVALGVAIDKLEAKNEKIIRAQSLDAWLPRGKHKLTDGTVVETPYSCSDFVRSNAPAKLGVTTVATLKLDAPQQLAARTSILQNAGPVYATAGSLYVSSQHWWWWPEDGQDDATYIHKFDLTDASKVTFLGSAVVPGTVKDSFSMDETNGQLRVVSNTAHRVVDNVNEPWGHFDMSNRVSVFNPGKNRLDLLAVSDDIQKGEWLSAARFVGNHAFLVTYRYVDPFITVDLTDAAHPHVVGTLEVPGFSTYLQAVDDTHLLSVGLEPVNGSAGMQALKVSLYDVTDFAHPQRTSSVQVGASYAWSDALYDHHAFNYYPEKKLLAIPYTDWDNSQTGAGYWSYFHSDLRVLKVDVSQGITQVGNLGFSDVYQAFQYSDWTWYWSPQVNRSVMADDFVYAISDAGIRVANIASLGTPLATALFTPLKTQP